MASEGPSGQSMWDTEGLRSRQTLDIAVTNLHCEAEKSEKRHKGQFIIRGFRIGTDVRDGGIPSLAAEICLSWELPLQGTCHSHLGQPHRSLSSLGHLSPAGSSTNCPQRF